MKGEPGQVIFQKCVLFLLLQGDEICLEVPRQGHKTKY